MIVIFKLNDMKVKNYLVAAAILFLLPLVVTTIPVQYLWPIMYQLFMQEFLPLR
jgi:hypothetical protein